MASRSATTERKLSFDVLCNTASLPDEDPYEYSLHFHRSKSGPQNIPSPNQKRKRNKKRKKKKKNVDLDDDDSINSNDDINDSSPREPFSMIPEDPATETSLSAKDYSSMDGSRRDDGVVLEENRFIYSGEGSVTCTVGEVYGSGGELRQRNVTGSGSLSSLGSEQKEEPAVPFLGTEEVASVEKENKKVANGSVVDATVSSSASTGIAKLETSESLDWKRLMAENPNYLFSVEQSPFKYFMEEMYKGNSLRNTTTFGSEKERERVYDTIFRLPWRCEMLIDVGFFVCFDSFLSLLTVMPTRIVMTFWRILNTRQFKKPSAAELSDIGCFIVLACGVVLLGRTDISLIYHMIRGQGTIKLYVVYNVLEIFDKLCQSFGGDVLQTLFNSAEGLASSPENLKFWIWRFIYDQALATAFSILHSFILLAQAITLSTCIVAHNNALLALLVSNNFAEIKSNVFKRFSKDNIHSLVYSDSVERFHISAFLVFVLAQNILEAEGPWFESFLSNALMVYFCEMLIDIIKHSFLAKFNDIKPIAYSEFLEELCNQTLDIQTDGKKKTLTFVPLAPACVVIRVLTPVYAAHLPYSPLLWRLFWMFLLFAMTYVMLTSLKIMIGMCLQKHAGWYVNRCRRRKHHLHFD